MLLCIETHAFKNLDPLQVMQPLSEVSDALKCVDKKACLIDRESACATHSAALSISMILVLHDRCYVISDSCLRTVTQKWDTGYAGRDYVRMLQLSFGWATGPGYPSGDGAAAARSCFPVVVTEMEAFVNSPQVIHMASASNL